MFEVSGILSIESHAESWAKKQWKHCKQGTITKRPRYYKKSTQRLNLQEREKDQVKMTCTPKRQNPHKTKKGSDKRVKKAQENGNPHEKKAMNRPGKRGIKAKEMQHSKN